MRLFDKLLNRKIKGRLETDDGINAENVIKKSNNIQTVVSYENNVVNVDRPVKINRGVSISQGQPLTFINENGNNLNSVFEVLSTLLPAGELTELFDMSGIPLIAIVLSVNGGVAVIDYDGQEAGTSHIINADSNLTFTISGGVVNITAVANTYVSTLLISRYTVQS